MNSALLYTLTPIIGLVVFCLWAKRQTDPLLVRRGVFLLFGAAAVDLGLASMIMFSLAHIIEGRIRPAELLAGWLFIVSVMLLYAAERRVVRALIVWAMNQALAGRKSLEGPTVRRWTELAAAVIALFLFLPYLFAASNCHRPKIGNARDPSSVGLIFERVPLRASDGVRLSGWYIPASSRDNAPGAPKATVLICHGIGVNSQNFLPIAEWLHDEGLNVMMFDLRGHGDSEGHVTSFGYYESRDVAAAVRYVQSRPDCDPKRIIGYAFSMGSASLAMSLKEGNPFCAVILDSPFACLATLQDKRLTLLGPLRRVMSPLVNFFCLTELGVWPAQIHPAKWIGRVSPKPLLIIHGTKDEVIPLSEGRELFAAAKEPKSLWIVPGATHVEARNERPGEYHRRVLGFVRRALKGINH